MYHNTMLQSLSSNMQHKLHLQVRVIAQNVSTAEEDWKIGVPHGRNTRSGFRIASTSVTSREKNSYAAFEGVVRVFKVH